MNGSAARGLLRILRPERGLTALTLAAGLVSVALTALGPWLLGRATDQVLRGAFHGGVDFTAVGRTLSAAVAVYLAAGFFSVVQGWTANLAVQRMLRRLRDDIATKLTRLPLSRLDGEKRGEVLSRATNDVDNLGLALQQALGQLLVPLFTIVGTLAVMFWISWPLALIAVLAAPLSILVAFRIGSRAQPAFRAQWAELGRVNAQIEEVITAHTLVKAFGREDRVLAEFADGNARLSEQTRRATVMSSAIQPVMMFFSNLTYVLIAVVGGVKVAAGNLTVGDVQAFIQYSRQYSQPFAFLAAMIGPVQSGLASADRVFELLDATEQSPDPDLPAGPSPRRGEVVFDQVSFRYTPDRPLIEDLSLTAEPGHTVAIVGPTGAGKTTLVNLLMRFYEIDDGRISLDGRDISALPRAALRSQIGMVLQDTWLFTGTVAENIAYGAPDATRAEIVQAARAARADHFIRTLPDGYDTIVDDDAAALSAGEKQLVTIARAFLADPPVLILDEATSSVDTRTETLIQEALASLRTGRTAFVIAHRLSTVRDADTILVMDRGSIVEQGTHETLLAAAGAYRHLHDSQFG